MALILICLLLIISFILIKKYGLTGIVLFFLLCGSTTDSAGILYGINSFFPFYKILIWILIFTFFFISISKIIKSTSKSFFKWYMAPFLLALLFISLSVFLTTGDLAYLSSMIVASGIPFFFMWIAGRNKIGSDKILFYVFLLHGVIAFIIILNQIDFSLINGFSYVNRIDANYDPEIYQSLIQSDLSFFNFNKYQIQKTGQFHNSNGLGFFSAILFGLGVGTVFKLYEPSLKNSFIIGALMMILGIILWFNSLTRGPIILLSLLFVFIFTTSWKIKKNFIFYGFIVLVFIGISKIYDLIILDFLVPSSDSKSISSRIEGYRDGWEAIKNNPYFGSIYQGSPPHIYPLKIMAFHGIPAGLLISIPIIHLIIHSWSSFKRDLKRKIIGESTFVMILVSLLMGVYLTNGVVSSVLFGILLAEACIRSGILNNKYSKCNKEMANQNFKIN